MRSRLVALAIVAAAATPARADVAGHVVDATTGDPIADARVSVRGGASTTTDSDGAFALAVDPGDTVMVVAAHAGHFNNWVAIFGEEPALVLALDAVPIDDDPTIALGEPLSCSMCHVEQYLDWLGSPMADAGKNTWVADLYDGSGTPGGDHGFVYTRDSAHADVDPASACASCHQPTAWATDPFTPLAAIDSGGPAVARGVSCDLCHKVAAIDTTRPNFPGIWPGVVRLARQAGAPIEFGVLGDTAYRTDVMRPAYNPQLTADLCAACHQDKNDPDDDGEFEEDDGVISEPTYLEWKASSYADPASPDHATCVDCHMTVRDDLASACTVQSLPRPGGRIRSHRIEGTTAPYLERAIRLELDARVEGGALAVTATIHNEQTGHHVPTGVTVRNMILRVEAFDADGAPLEPTGPQVIDALGGVGDPALGYWAGLPGKLYAKVPTDADGHAPVFFTEAASLADNRIAAHGQDATTYGFALPDAGGPVRVVARVVYRRAFRAVVDAKGWTADGHGEPLEDLAAPDFGHLMALVEVEVPGDAIDDGGCCGTGRGGAGAGALALVVLISATWRPIARRRAG